MVWLEFLKMTTLNNNGQKRPIETLEAASLCDQILFIYVLWSFCKRQWDQWHSGFDNLYVLFSEAEFKCVENTDLGLSRFDSVLICGISPAGFFGGFF